MNPGIRVARVRRGEGRGAEHVATVTIDNAAKLNCLNSPLLDALGGALETLAADPELRVVVLTGAGEKAFIGGADIRELASLDGPAAARAFISRVHRVCAAIRRVPVPVIARVNGWCLGAGLEIAAACDLRLAADGAMFGMPEVRVGLPSVVEAVLLPQLIGWGRTRQLVYLGRNETAQWALSAGLVEAVVPAAGLDAAVGEWVADVLEGGARAMRLQKALVADWERLSLSDAVAAGVDAFADAYETDEPHVMAGAFLARRR